MDRADIIAGSAFKAVLRSAVLFLVLLVLGTLFTLQILDRTLDRDLRARVQEMHDGVLSLEGAQNGQELKVHVNTLAKGAGGATLAYNLVDPGGNSLAGNIDVKLQPGEWATLSLDLGGPNGAEPFLVYASRVGDHLFVAGRSAALNTTARQSVIQSVALTGFLVVLAMLWVGYVLSRRSQEKLESIEHSLERVAEGDTAARVGVVRPRDQIDRISHKIDAQLDKLDAMVQATRRASAAVAHDLRKPLARVSLILERGLARAEAGEDTRAELEDGLEGLSKLNTIIATILRIARIESHDIGAFKRFDLRELLDEIADTYEAVAEDSGQHLVYTRSEREVRLVGDSDMIAQLVINLVQNAITHAGDGAEISLHAENRDGSIILTVADNGPGIPEDQRERVFEPLYRVDAARTKDGNGLGMALVKAIAERHHAEIKLSDARPGLCVSVAFPAA